MSVFDNLIEKNEFPIVFIGAGIPKRYLENYPSWHELLEMLWGKIEERNFYSYLNELRNEIKEKHEEQIEEDELDFIVNVEVASKIEKKINYDYNKEKITIEGITPKEVYEGKLSPFKSLISNNFSDYKLKEGIENEYEEFKKMLIKTQIILTTNYDKLIENSYNSSSRYQIDSYIGQRGLFQKSLGYSELYKIHGCYSDSESIVINKEDYDKFDSNSVLISAKVISSLLHSPIIFLGYSLTDRNVRKIIRDFTSSLNEKEKLELENRLIVVQWEKGEKELKEEVFTDKDLGCRLTSIKTDNYNAVYKKIQEVNQGVTPSEIRRYQHVIKELIVDRGKQGTLDTFLVQASDLDNFEELSQNSNLVVALGDKQIILKMPTILDYLINYIEEKTNENIEVNLEFIAREQPKSILPMINILTEENINCSKLTEKKKNRLKKRYEEFKDIENQKKNIPNKDVFKDLNEILESNFSIDKKYGLISYNLEKFDLDLIKDFILKELEILKGKKDFVIKTSLRRLILMYDLYKNMVTVI